MDLHFFDMDGNEVSSENWADALVSGAVKVTIEQYTQRATKNVSAMVCPTHGGKAQLEFNVTGTPEQPKIEIHAISCCDEFAQEAIKEAHRSWATN